MHYCLLLCLVFVFNVFSVAVLSSFCSLSSSSPSLSFFISFFFLLYLHCPLFVSSVFVVFSVLIFIFFSVLCCRLLNLLCLCFLFTVTSWVFFLLLCCLMVVFFSSRLFSSSSSVLFVSSLPLSSNHLGLLYHPVLHPVSSLTGRQVWTGGWPSCSWVKRRVCVWDVIPVMNWNRVWRILCKLASPECERLDLNWSLILAL